jgi:crossover junction endodeoxyribonuclease RusA
VADRAKDIVMSAPLFETHTFGAPTSTTITQPVLLARLRVDGRPVPQGSMRSFVAKHSGRVVTPQSKSVRYWRELIGTELRRYGVGYWPERPLELRAVFVLPRPQRLGRSKTAPAITRPDADKLLRACLDACSGVVTDDDSRFVSIVALKRFAAFDERPGVELELWSVPA